MSTIIYYNGRPDGIGNRLEELLHVEYYCISNNIRCCYYWDNFANDKRRYPILFECVNISIQDKIQYPGDMVSSISYIKNRDEMLMAAKNVKLIWPLETHNIQYTGVHIRTGDRIRRKVDHYDFMDISLFNRIFNFTVEEINKERPEYLFICSDNEKLKRKMASRLHRGIKVIDPLITKSEFKVYDDFYGLSRADKIYMCSKFSSYAITSSILSNIPVISFFDENESNLKRYYANVIIKNLPQGNSRDICFASIMGVMLRYAKRLVVKSGASRVKARFNGD